MTEESKKVLVSFMTKRLEPYHEIKDNNSHI